MTAKAAVSIEQVLAPLGVRVAHQAHDVAAGMQVEGARLAHQFHFGFAWQLIALAPVAGVAAGDQVFPGGSSPAGARHYMVQSQFAGRQDGAAILAAVAVAQNNVIGAIARRSGAECGDIPAGG